MGHRLTFEQVAARKEKAVRFLRDVLDDGERADEVDQESIEDYAARRHFVIRNPERKGVNAMAQREKLEDVLSDRDALIDKLEAVRDDIDDALAEYDGEDDNAEDED